MDHKSGKLDSAALVAWVEGAKRIHPLVRTAADDKCLSIGTLEDLASARGIRIVCSTNSVVAITPLPEPGQTPDHNASKIVGFVRHASSASILFEGSEHSTIGNSVYLYFLEGDGEPAGQLQLMLPNDLEVTYGDIVALAGDFYGIPSHPISEGGTLAERKMRFTNAYNTLAHEPEAKDEATQILRVMETESTMVNAAVAAGEPASTAYATLGDDLPKKWNRITGGGSDISAWIPMGRFLQLAVANYDHFGQHAIDSYVAGHTVAMEQAVQARRAPKDDQNGLLIQAYAMNAFADHFLSDVFSAAHARLPRRGLSDWWTPRMVESYFLRTMHDEDNRWGLHVVSRSGGSRWHAYGDKRYFDAVDVANTAMVNAAVQVSVREIFDAFVSGTVKEENEMEAVKMTPSPLGADRNPQDEEAAGNISPLFAMINARSVRREDLNSLDDYNWTSNWSRWGTLWSLLHDHHTGPPAGYPDRPNTAPTIDPNGWQVNHPVPPTWVDVARVRYAVSFVTRFYESDPGRWCGYVTVGNHAYPTLTGVPIGPNGTLARRIYRQFEKGWYTYVGQIPDNSTTTFVDGPQGLPEK